MKKTETNSRRCLTSDKSGSPAPFHSRPSRGHSPIESRVLTLLPSRQVQQGMNPLRFFFSLSPQHNNCSLIILSWVIDTFQKYKYFKKQDRKEERGRCLESKSKSKPPEILIRSISDPQDCSLSSKGQFTTPNGGSGIHSVATNSAAAMTQPLPAADHPALIRSILDRPLEVGR